LDAITNINKEDRIIITGMSNPVVMPQGFKEMVGQVMDKIEQGSSGKIIWINPEEIQKKYQWLRLS
jgi:hypothetical protein